MGSGVVREGAGLQGAVVRGMRRGAGVRGIDGEGVWGAGQNGAWFGPSLGNSTESWNPIAGTATESELHPSGLSDGEYVVLQLLSNVPVALFASLVPFGWLLLSQMCAPERE